MELLSPAGSWDQLKAAVSEGADAVYLGSESFNARRRAANFNKCELEKAILYSHDNGVRAYLTLNTLIKNHELKGFSQTLEHAYISGVDAIILASPSLIKPIKDSFPDLQVHMSTQTAVFNSLWKDLLAGADRIIMPREMSISQVKEFREKTGFEIEVFIQGALCFSISGQCLMSSVIGGRSGNRGLCAQPCRKTYNGSYLLSTKDLCIGENISDLSKAGVCSLKIEGRVRSPEYVGAATAYYRKLLDDGISDEGAFFDMQVAFNRMFAQGGLYKQLDVVESSDGGKRGIYLGKILDGHIALAQDVFLKDGVKIISPDGKAHGDIVKRITVKNDELGSGKKCQTADLHLNAKDGDTVWISSALKRRSPQKEMIRERIMFSRTKRSLQLPKISPNEFGRELLAVKAYSAEQAEKALLNGADLAFYDVFAKDHPGGKIAGYVPRCLAEWAAEKAISTVENLDFKDVLCADPAVAANITSSNVFLDISANTFNDVDVSFFNKGGLTPIISPELSFDEMKSFKDKRFLVYVHGRLPVMTTKYRLVPETLRDELGYTFEVRTELDNRQILNSVCLGLFNNILKLKEEGLNQIFVDLWNEPDDIVKTYRDLLSGKNVKLPKGYNQGAFKKPVA